jgi:ABC-2 type transport system permease protein
MIAIIFVMPVVQLILLGYVISSEVKNITMVICDLDQTAQSRELISKVETSKYFIIKYYDRQSQYLQDYLDAGDAFSALVIPNGFAKDLELFRETSVQVLLDGQDTNTASIALGYLSGIVRTYLRENSSLENTIRLKSQRVESSVRYHFNPNLEYSDYMVPAIAAFLLTMVTTLLSAMGLVRERQIGTMEQLSVTPIRKHELLIGKIIPFAILGFIELTLALIFAKLWYKIPMVGHLGVFGIFTIIYLFTTLGLGLFVSASSQTQQQALFMVWFLMVFGILMSGFIFPIENMPEIAQYISYLNPLRYFIIVIREIFIKGATVKHLYEQGLVLIVFGLVIFSFATLKFTQRVK